MYDLESYLFFFAQTRETCWSALQLFWWHASVSFYSEICSPAVYVFQYIYGLLDSNAIWGSFDILLPIQV